MALKAISFPIVEASQPVRRSSSTIFTPQETVEPFKRPVVMDVVTAVKYFKKEPFCASFFKFMGQPPAFPAGDDLIVTSMVYPGALFRAMAFSPDTCKNFTISKVIIYNFY
jgi:hypothetical protein